MGSRRKARILAFQSLYSWEMNPLQPEELLRYHWLEEEKKSKIDQETFTFANLLVSGCIENIDSVDRTIIQHLEHWNIKRLAKVDLALLRLGCYSLCYQKSIPPSVTIDEAIDIAKTFGGEDSYRFINGVLDGIRKSIEEEAE
jgi:N utilization substance protein B